jgi:hypothetical protein
MQRLGKSPWPNSVTQQALARRGRLTESGQHVVNAPKIELVYSL